MTTHGEAPTAWAIKAYRPAHIAGVRVTVSPRGRHKQNRWPGVWAKVEGQAIPNGLPCWFLRLDLRNVFTHSLSETGSSHLPMSLPSACSRPALISMSAVLPVAIRVTLLVQMELSLA